MLLKKVGEKVIKIDLDKNEGKGEIARALLFVAPHGFVKEHYHQETTDPETNNPDSELYWDLLDYSVNGPEKIKHKPEVAGNNSPTGRLKHSIEASEKPQVYLAIKKGQMPNAWKDFSNMNLADYKNSLNIEFEYDQENNTFMFDSRTNDRVNAVNIDLTNNAVSYLSKEKVSMQDNLWQETTLQELEAAREAQSNDLGMNR